MDITEELAGGLHVDANVRLREYGVRKLVVCTVRVHQQTHAPSWNISARADGMKIARDHLRVEAPECWVIEVETIHQKVVYDHVLDGHVFVMPEKKTVIRLIVCIDRPADE